MKKKANMGHLLNVLKVAKKIENQGNKFQCNWCGEVKPLNEMSWISQVEKKCIKCVEEKRTIPIHPNILERKRIEMDLPW